MNLKNSLAQARGIFKDNNIESAYLEGELLLRHILGVNRPQLYMDYDRELSPSNERDYHSLIDRRLRGEPTAYITGHREFYGLNFYVNRNVLIPRPETEVLVGKTIGLAQDRAIFTIADIGTGCGAIAISMAVNLPGAKIYATDISNPALEVARFNCRRHGVLDRICFLQGNMVEPLPEAVDLIVANMPYVRESELLRTGPLSFEPVLALSGGTDGLAKINQLSHQAGKRLRPGGCLLLEIGQGQGKTVETLLRKVWPSAHIEVATDFSGIERVVCMCLTQDFL
ncbi:peptide chain release factor N(5)-glutamine methyltransferase [Chloroflexota bacterium]